MIALKIQLRKLTKNWRQLAGKSRLASDEIPNLLARGHMQGLSDGLEVAADDIDNLLEPIDPIVPENIKQ
jgi:hypothetical protein